MSTESKLQDLAHRVWHIPIVRSFICDLAHSDTIANIARTNKTAFETAVKPLWGQKVYMAELEGRLEQVRSPVSPIRECGAVAGKAIHTIFELPDQHTGFATHVMRFPNLRQVETLLHSHAATLSVQRDGQNLSYTSKCTFNGAPISLDIPDGSLFRQALKLAGNVLPCYAPIKFSTKYLCTPSAGEMRTCLDFIEQCGMLLEHLSLSPWDIDDARNMLRDLQTRQQDIRRFDFRFEYYMSATESAEIMELLTGLPGTMKLNRLSLRFSSFEDARAAMMTFRPAAEHIRLTIVCNGKLPSTEAFLLSAGELLSGLVQSDFSTAPGTIGITIEYNGAGRAIAIANNILAETRITTDVAHLCVALGGPRCRGSLGVTMRRLAKVDDREAVRRLIQHSFIETMTTIKQTFEATRPKGWRQLLKRSDR